MSVADSIIMLDPEIVSERYAMIDLLGQVNASIQIAQTSMLTLLQTRDRREGLDRLPDWAGRHLAIHLQLERKLHDLEQKFHEGGRKLFDPSLTLQIDQVCQESQKIIQSIAQTVNRFVTPSIFFHKLEVSEPFYSSPDSSSLTMAEYFLNRDRLMAVHRMTDDPVLQREIEFLVLNYLAKSAPAQYIGGAFTKYPDPNGDRYQCGTSKIPMRYYRDSASYENAAEHILNGLLANGVTRGLQFIDTADISTLYPLFFVPVSGSATEDLEGRQGEWARGFAEAMIQQIHDQQPDPFAHEMKKPVLLDLTPFLKDLIVTRGDKENELRYNEKIRQIESVIDRSIDQAMSELQIIPDLMLSQEDAAKMKVYLKANLHCICITNINEIDVLLVPPLFKDLQHYILPPSIFESRPDALFSDTYPSDLFSGNPDQDLELLAESIEMNLRDRNVSVNEKLVRQTGTRLGSVSARSRIFGLMPFEAIVNDPPPVHRYVSIRNAPVIFSSGDEIVHSSAFQQTKEYMYLSQTMLQQPHIAILGRATVDLIEGLMKDIPATKWQELNENPDTRIIFQHSLVRLMDHLENAQNQLNDFSQFSQSIELAHCEIATLLSLTCPYDQGKFSKAYKRNLLLMVPPALHDHVKAGLAKSGINVMAGIQAIALSQDPKLQRVYGELSYFENTLFPGQFSMEEALDDAKTAQVSLYTGEFNHNVVIDMDHESYPACHVIEDVEVLLRSGKAAPHMTVAVDCTIDFSKSANVQQLLEHFSREITEGRLNFIFFRSGQKFDMLGMDNYYGAPFWMVNNGDKQWESYDQLLDQPFQTDPITNQWFSLIYRHSPKSIDDYKELYFSNARAILQHIPQAISPDGALSHQVRVSRHTPKTISPFIDVKLPQQASSTLASSLYEKLEQTFVRIAKKRGIRVQNRPSFGFFHPSWVAIPAPSAQDRFSCQIGTIRIHPGLNPQDNLVVVEFLEEISALLTESAI